MHSHGISEEDDKPCRACTDFKSWAKQRTKPASNDSKREAPNKSVGTVNECPLDKDDLGRQTWGFLHTMAAYYPEKPSNTQCVQMTQFFKIFADFYPCDYCAEDFRKDIKVHPPKTQSRSELEQWLCDMHNTVNVKLGKPKFDCSKVNERWKDGWADGSCD